MRQVLADFYVSISELKKNPSALISLAGGSPIAVLNHNKPAAYLIPAETYEAMMDMIDWRNKLRSVAATKTRP